ncbi:WXG100 family type VII secretion target [Bacillus sonorensis]|uniref:WXG100 family type VII secretion target n=1 Tax=Bacillus sonorensis TaxID=119858 RepID=UPI0004975C41|nr:WXG100 family type VII secretion target [Bacillus sonorensis]MCY8036383.1 WXG100 family type VII secretion target [Bacillus sonorensis]MCY8565412.1 WXG100 family type VII secretion target [Bacillus sonorensis]MEC1591941.1 WXG100 family type VII secretion target [Bacillus sonorensis]
MDGYGYYNYSYNTAESKVSGESVEISHNGTIKALSHAKTIEKHVGDSLRQAKDLKSYIESGEWNGKTRDAFLSYLELIIQLNEDMKDALNDHTSALNALEKSIGDFSKLSEVKEIQNL